MSWRDGTVGESAYASKGPKFGSKHSKQVNLNCLTSELEKLAPLATVEVCTLIYKHIIKITNL